MGMADVIQKIISGGQTGAERAALDAAIKLGIPYGGWLPKGRLTEDGTLPDEYELNEMPTSSLAKRAKQNILDSDGTLILSELPLKDKVTLANMAEVELDSLHFSLGAYIRRKFGLWSGNESLIESCRFVSGKKGLDVKAVPEVIIWSLWKKLKESYKLRIVKP